MVLSFQIIIYPPPQTSQQKVITNLENQLSKLKKYDYQPTFSDMKQSILTTNQIGRVRVDRKIESHTERLSRLTVILTLVARDFNILYFYRTNLAKIKHTVKLTSHKSSV